MICPKMSRPIKEKDNYNQDVTRMHYELCAEKDCAWWIKTLTFNGCSVKLIALGMENKIRMENKK